MFVGHYAAAFAASAAEPKAPLWTTVAGCQLIDIGWSAFIMAGIERASVDPSLPGSTLVLEHMPWTHSLPMTLVWALGAVVLARVLLRLPMWASVVIGLSVASHWLLDFIVHRPDLELWIGGEKVGLALWNYPVPEQALEMGLLAIFGAAWAASRKAQGRTAWPAVAFIAFLVTLQVVAMVSPVVAGPAGFQVGLMALVVYVVVVALAALTDRRGKAAA
jgi:hypothetical protein